MGRTSDDDAGPLEGGRRGGGDGEQGADPPAVILGGAVTALSVGRSLADAGIAVHVLDRPDSPVRHSRRCGTFVELHPQQMQEGMLRWLRTAGPRGAVVLACGDEGLELIARHRAELVGLGYRPMEADDELLLAMLDKWRTAELAHRHGIPAPRAHLLREEADLEVVSREFGYPCVLKPVQSHVFARQTKSSTKVLTVDNATELRDRFEAMAAIGVELLAIEVIGGGDDEYVSYYSYLDADGEPLLQFTKRKIRQLPNRFGCGTYHATTHDAEVAQAGLRFFQALGLRGLANVEFKRDGKDGQLKLIECNPRFTMSNEVIRIAGVDLALFSYNRILGRPTPAVDRYRDDVRLWDPVLDALAFLEYRRKGELSPREWLRSVAHRQHFPVARIDDPLPALVRLARFARNAGRGVGPLPRRLEGSRERALAALAERLGRSQALAYRVDLAASTGLGYAWRRVRAKRRLPAIGSDVRHALYEELWREAAETAGAAVERLAPGLLELSRDGVSTRVFDQVVGLDDVPTLQVALDKPLVHRLLRDRGLPVPDHVVFDHCDPRPAIDFIARVGGSFVVKPASGTGGGDRTTAGVTTAAQLRRASLHAAGGGRLLVERQAEGAVYRLLLLEGELLDVVRSVPGTLTGDGRSTIEELIGAENERRVRARGAAGLSLVGVNLDMLIAMERAGLKLSSVPAAGERVSIGMVTNTNASADNETVRTPLSPQLIAAAKEAQTAVGVRLAGVDVITTDPGRSLAEVGGVINEVNGAPALHRHYLVADPSDATRVAVPVLERLLAGHHDGAIEGRALPSIPVSALGRMS